MATYSSVDCRLLCKPGKVGSRHGKDHGEIAHEADAKTEAKEPGPDMLRVYLLDHHRPCNTHCINGHHEISPRVFDIRATDRGNDDSQGLEGRRDHLDEVSVNFGEAEPFQDDGLELSSWSASRNGLNTQLANGAYALQAISQVGRQHDED